MIHHGDTEIRRKDLSRLYGFFLDSVANLIYYDFIRVDMNETGSWAMQVKNAELVWRSKVRRAGRVGGPGDRTRGFFRVRYQRQGHAAARCRSRTIRSGTIRGDGSKMGGKDSSSRENPSMDAESRGEFERAVAMMNDGKNDKAIELLTKVIERSPGVTAPYINIAVAYHADRKAGAGRAAPQNRFGAGSRSPGGQ